MPMAPVSPSPLTPMAISVLFASSAPVRDRRHAAVNGVEAVRGAEEVRRALARAADARQLDDLTRIDAQLVSTRR